MAKQIFIKLVDCILQSRVNVKKSQIYNFHEVHQEIRQKNYEAYQGKRNRLLDNLIHVETYGLRQRINYETKNDKIKIGFSLFDLESKTSILTESWMIRFDEHTEYSQKNEKFEFIMLARLIEELLFFLNQQPLFTEFYRNSENREKFKIVQSIEQTSEKQQLAGPMKHCFVRQRNSHSLSIKIQCSSLPRANIYELLQAKFPKNPLSTIDTSLKKLEKSLKSPKKINLFEIHDEQLDLIVLSSDEEIKIDDKGSKWKVKEVEIDDTFNEQSGEFQLLICSLDEQKLEECLDIFQELVNLQQQYLSNKATIDQ